MADITYIETDTGVVYLHLLTDAFTHEIIGWTLFDSLVASNTVAALDMGIKNVAYLGLDGLIHHSDRGVQYCCNQYIEHLRGINATISMTEDYKPPAHTSSIRVSLFISSISECVRDFPKILFQPRPPDGPGRSPAAGSPAWDVS